jgi:L-2-hydroxyglutarate oxidase
MQTVDVTIIGGGIVGLATAYQLLQRYPDRRVVVLEKEATVAFHQTGRNSGVMHSGIYYKPGTLRATNCRSGKQALETFCQQHGVAFDVCGKVIVAVAQNELGQLQKIYERGQANGVRCEMIGRERLCELEPHTAGIQAIHVPEAGIVDYPGVCHKLVELIRAAGSDVVLNARVTKIDSRGDGVTLVTTAGEFSAHYAVNCAGLHSDRVTTLGGQRPDVKIVPFRGEYFELKESAHHLCRTLIYPVPDPNFPFLGVHFTRLIHGGVECGPNAVLAFAREGYHFWDVNLRDLWESLTYRGFQRIAMRNWRTGLGEMWRSLSKAAFVRALQRLVPEIRSEDMETAPSGVRAQALTPEGNLAEDFLIQEHDRIVNVNNAPSPAATASLNIGRLIVDKLAPRLDA